MKALTEDSIKKSALQFLKRYYKYRPRLGDTTLQTDLTTPDGTIIDGQLRFQKTNTEYFTATIEATSKKKKDEVYFKTQHHLVFWDSLATGSLLTLLAFVLLYMYDTWSVVTIGWLGAFLKFILFLSVGAWLVHFLIRNRARYRYIYAVEQFKRYHADEQWIAIGHRVFENDRKRKYLNALKRQCVLNGFGLLEVHPDHGTQLLIAPARKELFNTRQRITAYFNRQKRKKKKSRYEALWKSYYAMFTDLNEKELSLLRYQKSVHYQLIIFLFATVLCSFVVWKEWQERPVIVVNEKKFEKQLFLKQLERQPLPEPDSFELDSPEWIIRKQNTAPYLSAEKLAKHKKPPPDETVKNQNRPDRNTEVFIETKDVPATYDCSRFYNLKGTHYIILDSQFKMQKKALQRMRELRKMGIQANTLWLGCIDKKENDYAVYLNAMYSDYFEAMKDAATLGYELKDRKLLRELLEVRKVKG